MGTYLKRRKIRLSAWQILALGYLTIIFIGSILLSLPFATTKGESTSYLNALFTSTSATCVTGLVAYDTGTHWTIFGQIVILGLIQTGGLGFMTFVTLLFNLIGKNMGVYNQKLLMLSAGEENRSSIARLFKRLLLGTIIFETCGAVLLSTRFVADFGVKGIYYAVFHSVSAFCNAGFDLLGGEFSPFCSLTHYATDPIVSLTVCALILIGGLGFCVWDDVLEARFNPKKFRLHTKVALILTALLVLFPTIFFYATESNGAFENFSTAERWLVALFASISPRTAGFNTIPLETLSDGGYLMTVLLMAIGGSSGSTAGGIKITTCAVIVMGILSVFRGKKDIEIGKRRVRAELLHQAMAIFITFLSIVVFATLVICIIETDNNDVTLLKILFETVSAIGTVGLSLSLTPLLSPASKIVLILLMYAGRVGILTIALAFAEKKDFTEIKKPLENILIG